MELFKMNTIPEMTKCDCILKKGKPVPTIEQRTVYLHLGLDPRFIVGTCNRCKKIHSKKAKK